MNFSYGGFTVDTPLRLSGVAMSDRPNCIFSEAVTCQMTEIQRGVLRGASSIVGHSIPYTFRS